MLKPTEQPPPRPPRPAPPCPAGARPAPALRSAASAATTPAGAAPAPLQTSERMCWLPGGCGPGCMHGLFTRARFANTLCLCWVQQRRLQSGAGRTRPFYVPERWGAVAAKARPLVLSLSFVLQYPAMGRARPAVPALPGVRTSAAAYSKSPKLPKIPEYVLLSPGMWR